MTEAEAVRENLDSFLLKVAALTLKYRDLLRNYTLAMLICLQDYDGIDLRRMTWTGPLRGISSI